jgi:intracellular sulfur oxidation DsrE/DsrF family protein
MVSTTEKVTPRRQFMRQVGVGAVALAAGATGLRLDAEEPSVGDVFSPKFDETWLTKLNGKHRQFFDATSVNQGFPLLFALVFMNQNNAAYSLQDNQLSAVVGLRHEAVPIGLSDPIWAKYKLGEFFKITDNETKAPATRNVFAHTHPGDMMMSGGSVNELQARGVTFTACNVALTVLSGMAAQAAGLPADKAHDEWVAGLLPGVVLVPAGVLAVNRAQERGCTYCYAG